MNTNELSVKSTINAIIPKKQEEDLYIIKKENSDSIVTDFLEEVAASECIPFFE